MITSDDFKVRKVKKMRNRVSEGADKKPLREAISKESPRKPPAKEKLTQGGSRRKGGCCTDSCRLEGHSSP